MICRTCTAFFVGFSVLIPTIPVWGQPADLAPAVAEKPTPKPVITQEQIALLIQQLGAEAFADRETAMQKLREAGSPAIPSLKKAATSGDLEVTLRAVRVLESFLTSGSLQEYQAAELAVEELGQSEKKSVSSRAETVLASLGEVREKRAIAAIRQLNGSVREDPRNFVFGGNVVANGQEMMTTVILNRRWKGGEAGLKHLERLRFLRTVYLVEGVLTPEAETQLKNKFPERVQMRGRACLGVAGGFAETGTQIQLVNPGSAADKAGLQEGDIIVAFNGKRGENDQPLDFPRLVELIKEHDAGDKVPVLIRRDGREQTLHVVLDEWK